MNTLGLVIQSVLASIGAIAANPALGAGVVVTKLLPLIGVVSTLIGQGMAALEKLKELDLQLKTIVSEGRVPTDEEWAEWNERHESAKARLQS